MSESVPDRAVELLTSERLIGHLATSHDDRPHAAPVWYLYRDGAIEVATTGRKLEDVRRNPRVALSVQKDEDGHARWGVSIHGTATVIGDDEESEAALHRINRKYDADEDAWSENTPVRIDIGSASYWEY